MPPTESRQKLLDAAVTVVRQKGYADTTVDDLCAAAGVTKGSFFHHFKTKEDLVLSAVGYWNDFTTYVFADAPYTRLQDPLERLLGYVDFRIAIMERPVSEFTCLLGTLVQETYETHPAVRQACEQGMADHIAVLVKDIEAAKTLHAPQASWSAESVGYFIQSVLQGSFIYAKAQLQAGVARQNLLHLRRYLELIFTSTRH